LADCGHFLAAYGVAAAVDADFSDVDGHFSTVSADFSDVSGDFSPVDRDFLDVNGDFSDGDGVRTDFRGDFSNARRDFSKVNPGLPAVRGGLGTPRLKGAASRVKWAGAACKSTSSPVVIPSRARNAARKGEAGLSPEA
jgi:hypothetical protein